MLHVYDWPLHSTHFNVCGKQSPGSNLEKLCCLTTWPFYWCACYYPYWYPSAVYNTRNTTQEMRGCNVCSGIKLSKIISLSLLFCSNAKLALFCNIASHVFSIISSLFCLTFIVHIIVKPNCRWDLNCLEVVLAWGRELRVSECWYHLQASREKLNKNTFFSFICLVLIDYFILWIGFEGAKLKSRKLCS